MESSGTIRVSKETRRLLERLAAALGARLGRSVDMDYVVRFAAEEALARMERRPELLRMLFREPVEGHDTSMSLRVLREERLRDDRF